MKIIVMDHDEETKDNLCGYLNMSKHSCNCCNCKDNENLCIEEISRLVNTYNPDVIVTDLKMPKMNGIDLLKVIKKQYPRIKVLILTEDADIECAMDAVNFGADGFFRKTLDNIKFTKKIREIEKSVSMRAG